MERSKQRIETHSKLLISLSTCSRNLAYNPTKQSAEPWHSVGTAAWNSTMKPKSIMVQNNVTYMASLGTDSGLQLGG